MEVNCVMEAMGDCFDFWFFRSGGFTMF